MRKVRKKIQKLIDKESKVGKELKAKLYRVVEKDYYETYYAEVFVGEVLSFSFEITQDEYVNVALKSNVSPLENEVQSKCNFKVLIVEDCYLLEFHFNKLVYKRILV